MAKYLDETGLTTLWGKVVAKDTATLTAAKNDATSKVNAAKSELQESINDTNKDVTTLEGYFTSGAANKALADGSGNNIVNTYVTKTTHNTLSGKVTTLEGYFTSGVANKALADGNGKNIANTYATKTALETLSGNYATLSGYFTEGAAKKAIADGEGNNIVDTYAKTNDITTGVITAYAAQRASKDGDGNVISTTYIKNSQKGVAGGVAPLGDDKLIPSEYLPGYVDDAIEGYYYQNKFYKEAAHTTQIVGEAGKVYVDLSTNKTYRWSGSTFVQLNSGLALGETTGSAYDGAKGKANAEAIAELEEVVENLDAQGVKYSGQGVSANTVDGAIAELANNISQVEEAIPTIEAITTAEINTICV